MACFFNWTGAGNSVVEVVVVRLFRNSRHTMAAAAGVDSDDASDENDAIRSVE